MIRRKILFKNEEVWAWVQKNKGTLWLHLEGHTYCYSPKPTRSRADAQESANPGVVVAPMPGKVIAVNCQKGDEVSREDVLVVMEAMKMEYSLKSDISGKVELVSCEAGDQVALADVLVKVESHE